LGFYTAEAFLLAGAKKVILTARRSDGEEGLDQAVQKLNAIAGINGKAVSITANIADTEEIERVVTEIKMSDGHLDILVANAGATWGGPFELTPDSSNVKLLDLNVRSIFNLVRL
jgi:NAD(P)-dependent dehydrogenase (short-subunit alcohol dehydrogenase family)